MSITPSVAFYNIEQCSMPIYNGNTLYVGGTGEGNYTRIQDAINDANDGDTIFVYDDSSPYEGFGISDKSVNLVGENKNTTIIDEDVWVRNSNDFSIQGLTFVGISEDAKSVYFDYCSNFTFYDNIIQVDFSIHCLFIWYCSDVKIFRNHIKNLYLGSTLVPTWWGVAIWGSQNCIIENNFFVGDITPRIMHLGTGIIISEGTNITVVHNHISRCSNAIDIKSNSTNITVVHNHISRCIGGIDILSNSNDIIIMNNHISRCRVGIEISRAGFVDIIQNNFILNIRKIKFNLDLKDLFSIFLDGNYWGRPRILPKLIFGRIGRFVLFPWFNIDRHPAQEPYDIEV